MKSLLKLGVLLACAMAATVSLLMLVFCAILQMELGEIIRKMNSELVLYMFPAFILVEFCFLINDLLAHLSGKYRHNFGFEFSEVRFGYELDNNNAPIPPRIKLQQLYPLSIAMTLLGFVLVLISR
ncbi:hypothetical protein IVB22_02500 [Bradyrhizobium sp. 190]|uniref:hypothetical protein n=1 Tax=Bradyrhizobium sp. 190 TaxID=2782658 RepID=UPI001FF7EE5B|nr:hypothetical protein [Bradyrhizobium sp. 190]MCK1511461.1 hypothetical protein [Bradyrhizobium sp. 190]